MYEYPPMLMGSEQQQLHALRDYLVRLARSLETAETAPTAASSPKAAGSAAADAAIERAAGEQAEALRRNAANLRALIVKNAAETESRMSELRQELESSFMARSDFGEYMEHARSSFSATARGVVESYDYGEQIRSLSERAEALDLSMSTLRGEIRRGLIIDPESGETVLGIAVAEKLRFTGAVHEEDGLQYYVLEPGQTLGLYTAGGWQFWVNGAKRGWFDSRDGRLHVISEAVADSLQLGGEWAVSAAGGFGIKYVGA